MLGLLLAILFVVVVVLFFVWTILYFIRITEVGEYRRRLIGLVYDNNQARLNELRAIIQDGRMDLFTTKFVELQMKNRIAWDTINKIVADESMYEHLLKPCESFISEEQFASMKWEWDER